MTILQFLQQRSQQDTFMGVVEPREHSSLSESEVRPQKRGIGFREPPQLELLPPNSEQGLDPTLQIVDRQHPVYMEG